MFKIIFYNFATTLLGDYNIQTPRYLIFTSYFNTQTRLHIIIALQCLHKYSLNLGLIANYIHFTSDNYNCQLSPSFSMTTNWHDLPFNSRLSATKSRVT